MSREHDTGGRGRGQDRGGRGQVRVLVACEYSGVVRDAFRARGYDAMSCDLLPSETDGPHYQGDVLDLIDEPYDLVIAHPPCTYLAQSGVRWLDDPRHPDRREKMREAAEFFAQMADFNSPRLCIENPVQHHYAKDAHGLGDQTQVIHPWMFGHPEKKQTCLWLRGLPMLEPTMDVREKMRQLPRYEQNRIWWMPPGPDRAKRRSRTYRGIAAAMASQWGPLLAANGDGNT